jgi:putative FmdB family regulatory protein
MPLYDYSCPACDEQREVQHSMNEIGKIEVLCTNCGEKMKKQLSMPTLLGFDDVGRSISKKDRGENSSKETSTANKDAA